MTKPGGSAHWQPGRLLDNRYRLLRPVGAGGSASVWRARDERLGRVVAVKLLDPKLLTDELALQRLRTEAQALARLRHPHIAEVYDYGVTGVRRPDAAYLAMELIDGESVNKVLARQACLDWRVAVTVATQVAAALAAAHARGIVHRDIAPSNILLAADGAKVIDFGICALQGADDLDPGGYLAGTPAYLAPERIDEPQPLVRPTADVYALGVLLYRMLSGDVPWIAESAVELLTAAQTQQPRPLPPITGLPSVVVETVTACLQRDPTARPTAQQVTDVLTAHALAGVAARAATPALSTDAPEAFTQLLPWRPSRRYRHTVLTAGLAGLGAVAVAVAWASSSPTAQPSAAAAGPSPTAPTVSPCTVVYRLHTDDGTRFTAQLIIANTTSSVMSPGQLTVHMPGDQQIDAADGWQQREHTATAAVGPLAGGGTAQLPLAGTYRGANPLPTSFSLDGSSCSLTLLGPSGQPIAGPTAGPHGPTGPAGPGGPGPAAPGPSAPPPTGATVGVPAPPTVPTPTAAGPGPARPGKPSALPSPARPSRSPKQPVAAADQPRRP